MHEGLLNPLQASQEDQNTVTMAPQKSLCPPQMKHYVSGKKAIILNVYEIFKQCFDSRPLPLHEATCAASSRPSTTSAREGASLNICTAGRTKGAGRLRAESKLSLLQWELCTYMHNRWIYIKIYVDLRLTVKRERKQFPGM